MFFGGAGEGGGLGVLTGVEPGLMVEASSKPGLPSKEPATASGLLGNESLLRPWASIDI